MMKIRRKSHTNRSKMITHLTIQNTKLISMKISLLMQLVITKMNVIMQYKFCQNVNLNSKMSQLTLYANLMRKTCDLWNRGNAYCL